MAVQRYKEIDLLRGMSIILVLLGHAILVFPINLHEITWCRLLFKWLSSVHMPLFFFVSGFCYSMGKGGYKAFCWKKTKRLIVPYLSFGVLDMLMRVFFSSMVNNKRGIVESVMNLLFDGGGYWFLYVLYIMFLFFPATEILLKKQEKAAWILLPVLAFLECTDMLPDIFMLDSVGYYLIYFILGYLAKHNLTKLAEVQRRFDSKSILVFAASACCWLFCVGLTEKMGANGLLNIVTALLGIATMWFVANALRNRSNGFLNDCSKYSLPLYLLNGYLLVISRTILVSKLGVTDPVIIIGFNMFVTLFVAWLIIKYVIDKVKLFKFFFGMN